MRKVNKVKFFFTNGDEVTVLTKTDNERECLGMMAKAVMCNREKEGNIQALFVMVHREGGIKRAQRASAGTVAWLAGETMAELINEAPKECKMQLASRFLHKLADACGLDPTDEDEEKKIGIVTLQ